MIRLIEEFRFGVVTRVYLIDDVWCNDNNSRLIEEYVRMFLRRYSSQRLPPNNVLISEPSTSNQEFLDPSCVCASGGRGSFQAGQT